MHAINIFKNNFIHSKNIYKLGLFFVFVPETKQYKQIAQIMPDALAPYLNSDTNTKYQGRSDEYVGLMRCLSL